MSKSARYDGAPHERYGVEDRRASGGGWVVVTGDGEVVCRHSTRKAARECNWDRWYRIYTDTPPIKRTECSPCVRSATAHPSSGGAEG